MNREVVTSKKSAVVGVIPGFVLRRLNPEAIMKKYREGFYRTMALPRRVMLRAISIQPTALVSNHGQGPEDEIYGYRDKNNVNQTIMTTNHAICIGNVTPPYICDNCRCQFNEEGIGVPLRLTKKSDGSIECITDGCNCTYECALEEVRRHYPNAIRYRDPQYMDSEQILKYLFQRTHPNAPPLRRAKDTRLLAPNGPMDRATWLTDTHTYQRMPNIVMIPCKAQYIQSR